MILKIIFCYTTIPCEHSTQRLLLPIIEYANTIWSPIISYTSLKKFQKIQNSALRTITRCSQDTHTQHLNSETKILPLQSQFKLHASQFIQKASHPTHPLHPLTTQKAHFRYKKQSTFNKFNYIMMGRRNVLYVVMSVSLLLPQCVVVRSFKRLSVFFAFVMVLSVWVENFSLGSKVRPRMVGLEMVEIEVLLMFSGLLYPEGSGFMSVVVVLVGLICRLLL